MKNQIIRLVVVVGVLLGSQVMAQEVTGTQTFSISELRSVLSSEKQAQFDNGLKELGVDYNDVSDMEFSVNPETFDVNVVGQPEKHTVKHLVSVGVQVGIYMPKTYEALYMLRVKDGTRPLVDGKIFWSPTKSHEQAKGIAVDVHPFNHSFYVGGAAQMIDFLPVSDPWYNRSYDRVYGQSATMGFRGVLGKSGVWQDLVGTFELGSTWIISKKYDYSWQPRISIQFGLNLLLTPNVHLKKFFTRYKQASTN